MFRPRTKKIKPALWDWIYSWMWHRNCKGDAWGAMPKLFNWRTAKKADKMCDHLGLIKFKHFGTSGCMNSMILQSVPKTPAPLTATWPFCSLVFNKYVHQRGTKSLNYTFWAFLEIPITWTRCQLFWMNFQPPKNKNRKRKLRDNDATTSPKVWPPIQTLDCYTTWN